MVINSLDVNIITNVDNGIYICESQSASGKTRLLQLLELLRERGEKVFGYTYSDYTKGVNQDIIPDDTSLLFIDRYDMYRGVLTKKILSVHEYGGLVLVDAKMPNLYLDGKVNGEVEVSLVTANKIIVEDPFK